MSDYQLERLNTRSFEQLVQALGIAIIGPQLAIFGDGPDGGREATFNGPVNYPGLEKNWDGYGIVQAKFRQKPETDAKKNADWAIEQLEAEFKKIEPLPKSGKLDDRLSKRPLPNYYIFATNIVLSPVSERGGKDRLRTLLEKYKKSHGLKDYAIWDGDQIRTFLDVHIGIRTTYSAWLLSGDVLGQMLKFLELDQTDFASTIHRYLESELLDDEFARLGQGGYTEAVNIPLCNVFVDLPVTLSTEDHSEYATHLEDQLPSGKRHHGPFTFIQLFLEEGRQLLRPSARLGTSAHSNGRLVLIGGPGQGKTTLGQYACQLFRAELLLATGRRFAPEVTRALKKIKEAAKELPQVCARRYPLRVDLKHLAAEMAAIGSDKAKNLFDYFVKRISERTNSSLKSVEFRRWLSSYPWVLVLDGLDEVPASSNRVQVMQAIRDFISIEAHEADADLLILATTRPQGYSDEFDPSFYRHLPLSPLSPDRALDYGQRLAKARHPDMTRVDSLTASVKRATENPATVRLMQSPLQVTIMLALIEGGGEPPEQRWKLFHDYYEVIYRREKERGTYFSVILGQYEPDIRWIHRRAGWLLQKLNASAGTTDARLTHEEFTKLVDDRLKESGHEDANERLKLVQAIRSAATDRLVLLVGNTEKEIGFEVRSLQEFMAAEHIFDGREKCIQNIFHTIALYPYWLNVFLFAAGRVYFERQELVDTITAVCGELNDLPADEAQRAVFSGSRLALALLKDGAARNQPGRLRVLARCAAFALDAQDDEIRAAFLEVFSNEAEQVWKEELYKRLSVSGSSFPNHNWLLCLQLVDSGQLWANELLTKHFPWKDQGARTFIADNDICAEVVPPFFWRQFARHVFSHPLRTIRDLLANATLPAALDYGSINQFDSLFRSYPHEDSYPLKAANQRIGILFHVRGPESLIFWSKFQYDVVPFILSHPEWQLCDAITEFAKYPTQGNLADQIESVSQLDLPLEGLLLEHFPWQIAVCISARKSGCSWEEVISGIMRGAIGSEGDWSLWDEEKNKGITLSQFSFKSESAVSYVNQGLILNNSSWTIDSSPEQFLLLASELTRIISRVAELKIEKLLQICVHGLGTKTFSSKGEFDMVVMEFVESCASNAVNVDSIILKAILRSSLTIQDKGRLLASVSENIRSGWLETTPKKWVVLNLPVTEILKELSSFEECWKILRVFSFLPPIDSLKEIPEGYLQQLQLKGEAFTNASLVLRISSFRWQASESTQIVRDFFQLKGIYPDHLCWLLDCMDLRGETASNCESFIVELLKQPDLGVPLRKKAASLLLKLVGRRPILANLPDPLLTQIVSL